MKNAISKRDDALVLGDAAAESLDKLRESKKEVTDAKLAKHEAEADETRETYVRLNEECGQQLQDFFARRTDDFDLMLKQLVAAQVALFKVILFIFFLFFGFCCCFFLFFFFFFGFGVGFVLVFFLHTIFFVLIFGKF